MRPPVHAPTRPCDPLWIAPERIASHRAAFVGVAWQWTSKLAWVGGGVSMDQQVPAQHQA
eukprot:241534-Chlamydomonas_euryale.AAC.1